MEERWIQKFENFIQSLKERGYDKALLKFVINDLNKYTDKEKALKEAQKISENNNVLLYVILSNGDYFIDENNLVRVWETLIATFENGKKIKS
ncbi:hypothetical protein GNY06_00715 [Elizabethkingia argentiflava]|uniref:Uncharacterized protein n=1 Tax=Elizabethkingia argenteiflava TaxID=2681556 RepID=A0A845PSS0_9FLAO|nr:hypothetical protein [Elizabethkingia argenteiflava]NAW49976.1 hypothetical protein [Elizabethkingia argenteiflava]